MALPTLVKNWEIIENQTVPADGTLVGTTNAFRDRLNLLLNIKNQLVAAGTSDVGPAPGGAVNAWTVTQSCDAFTVNTSGDLWTAETDMTFNTLGVVHSWIVLEQTGIDTNFQICLDCQVNSALNDGARMTVAMAPGGYNTDGTLTSRPTPVVPNGELVVDDREPWSGSDGGSGADYAWHMWRSEDGSCTHLVIFVGNTPITSWFFCAPQDPSPGWSGTQFVASASGKAFGTPTLGYANYYDAPVTFTWRPDRISTANAYNRTSIYLSARTFGFGPFGQELTVSNQITGEYHLDKMGLVSLEGGFRGKMGSLFDVYWGQETLGSPADNYPAGGSKQWVQFGSFVFPWNGAIPVTS